MSLALVICPSASKPQQLTKLVSFIPSPFARSFIMRTNSDSEPATCSAMATQASLALATLIHLIIVSTVWVSPGSKNTWEPPMLAAYSETVTVSSKEICLDESASKIRSSVMILVTLAGCLASWEFFS